MKSIVTILCFIFMGLGIASAQDKNEPTATDPYAELEKVKAACKETWAHPDADSTKFSKIFPLGRGIPIS